MSSGRGYFLWMLSFGIIGCSVGAPSKPVPGAPSSGRTRTLASGAKVVQDFTPVDQISMVLAGLHPLKDDPDHQMLAHHFCHQMNEEFAQCVLYDGNGDKARITGVEFIISERLFASLPAEERPYWHPHNYEILSGQLVGPGLPGLVEEEELKTKINSYGKTWHVWNTGVAGGEGDALPLGPARLAWSFNQDGEARREVLDKAQAALGVNFEAKRKSRRDLAPLARPQQGEDALRGKFR